MIDLTNMKPTKKLNYIFAQGQSPLFPNGRFHWIEDMLGDVQTFLDGIDSYLQSRPPHRGGGNVSVPILIGTGLELVSALHAGETRYTTNGSYQADTNVRQFVIRFFPQHYGKFSLLIWDGVRNGVTHLFFPKPLQHGGETIRFQFSVDDKRAHSYATKEGDTIFVRINDFELYHVFRKAIEDYRLKLETDEELQNRFIQAWDSIETYIRPIHASEKDKSSEAGALLTEIEKSNNHLVLWKEPPASDAATGSRAGLVFEEWHKKAATTVNDSIANTTLPGRWKEA